MRPAEICHATFIPNVKKCYSLIGGKSMTNAEDSVLGYYLRCQKVILT